MQFNYQRAATLSIAFLLAFAAAGAGAVSAAPTDAMSAQMDGDSHDDDRDGDDEADDEVNLTAVTVSAVDALRTAENETNGTPVTLDLKTHNDTAVYEILVVQANGTLTEVVVDAREGTALNVTSTDRNTTVRTGTGTVNLSETDLLSATAAVENATNATNATDLTVTEVKLRAFVGALIYQVELESPTGNETIVAVDATPGPVLTVIEHDVREHEDDNDDDDDDNR